MSIFKKRPDVGKVDSLIGNKTFFEGKIRADGGIRIDGAVKGSVECQGILVVGGRGKIEADIVADSVIIGGEIVGNILAKDRLEITSKAKVRGDIVTSHLIIDEGVTFEGSCHMLTEEKSKDLIAKKETALQGLPEDSKKPSFL